MKDIEYEQPKGVMLTKEIVLFLILFGTFLFCCGCVIAYCLVSAYRKRKKVLSENIAAWEDGHGIE